MADEQRQHCRSCRARLRRGQPEVLCDPCARAARSWHGALVPADFYDSPSLRAALSEYEFGPVLRAVRVHSSLTQEDLGHLIELPQGLISQVEAGKRKIRNIAIVARIAGALGIPARLLGFDPSPAGSVDGEEEVGYMDRRDFLATIAAIALDVGAEPDLQRLDSLLPSHTDRQIPHHVGVGDVAVIEQTTAAFRAMDRKYGGEVSRSAAIAQLRAALGLRNASGTEEVKSRLLVAIADLATAAGWASYDVEQHDIARRLWMIALDTARQARHLRSADLTALVLVDIAHQAVHLRRPTEALKLLRLAATTETGSEHPVSTSTRGYIAAYRAQCHGMLGKSEPCLNSLAESMDYFTASPDERPWTQPVTPAGIAAHQGQALYLLAQAESRHATRAIEQLRLAVDGFGPAYARSHALNSASLAGTYFLAGEVDSAIATGHAAVTGITALSSTRGHARLHDLDRLAARYQQHAEATELRNRIRTVLSSSAA